MFFSRFSILSRLYTQSSFRHVEEKQISMRVQFYSSETPEALKAAIEESNNDNQFQSHIVIAGDANDWSADDLDDWLKQQTIPVFGAVFPQIIHEKDNYEKGFIVVSLSDALDWKVVDGLSAMEKDYDDDIGDVSDDWSDGDTDSTLLVFADGMSSRIAALIEALFFNFGLDRNFVGGGAGSLSFQQKPCILCPDGFLEDVALLLHIPLNSGVGVAHGWQPVTEQIKVTKSDRNVILELDYKDAFDYYKKIVNEQSGQSIGVDNFFDIAKSYPFGIVKIDAEMVVRDPLMPTEDGKGLVCVGEVPEECFVKILKGTPENLISAAGTARQLAEEDWNSRYEGNAEAGLFIDCISRVLFLENQMADEIANVSENLPLFGALTLGEIANNGTDYLEFYNKTAVLCMLGKS